jgi:hypothetical protein
VCALLALVLIQPDIVQFVLLLPPWSLPLLSPALAVVFSSPAPLEGSGIGAVLFARSTRVD